MSLGSGREAGVFFLAFDRNPSNPGLTSWFMHLHGFFASIPETQDTGISARVEGHFRRGSVRCGAVRDVRGRLEGLCRG